MSAENISSPSFTWQSLDLSKYADLTDPEREAFWVCLSFDSSSISVCYADVPYAYRVIAETGAGYTVSDPVVIPANSSADEKASAAGYAVVYKLNGGTNHPENPQYCGSALELMDPSRTGYTFDGWYTDSKFKKAFTGIVSGKLTVYAKWTANTYIINYSGNGAENIEPYSQAFTYGKSAKLTVNQFEREGFAFAGWNTELDGTGTSYPDKKRVSDLLSGNGEEITLYAQWKPIEYKITYKLNDGKNDPDNPSVYTVEDEIWLSKPSRTGYFFEGWYADKKFEIPLGSPEIPAGSSGAKTVYAKWVPVRYTLVFNANRGGENIDEYTQEVTVGTTKYLTANSFSFDGLQFTGWNTEPDGSGESCADQQSVKTLGFEHGETITLYAQWRDLMRRYEYRGTDYIVVNTEIPIEEFAELTYRTICQAPNETGVNQYDGKCLSFASYYCACLVKGTRELDIRSGKNGKHSGVSISPKKYKELPDLMQRLYTALNTGKPQIIMVEAVIHPKSRHFVTVVGYKASVTSADMLTAEDLLIIDTFDGQLEAMDPQIFDDPTCRVMFKQGSRYRMDLCS